MFSGYRPGQLYVLEKDLPQLKAGVIFELREATEEIGSPTCGYMTNIWVNHDAQDGWAEGTHILPGQLSKDREWFTPVREHKQHPEIFIVNKKRFSRIREK